jgi:aminoglycoside phosphotransferase (APT) family kinase protein
MSDQRYVAEINGGGDNDVVRLGSWLHDHIVNFEGPFTLTPLEGGQSNPTFKIKSRSHILVLRRKPGGQLLPSAHAVDREFRVLRALQQTSVPVPHAHAFCEDSTLIGSIFYVMDFIDGRKFLDPRLPGLSSADRAAIFDSLNKTIANLHSANPETIGLNGYGRPGNYVERQIQRWTQQYRSSEPVPIPEMEHLMDWLPRHRFRNSEAAVVHGDFKMDNVILHKTEPRVIAVLDWELSTLGDPLVDFAYHALPWRISPEVFRGLAGANLKALGVPSEREYLASYCRRIGREPPDDWDFYMVFCMFRIAAILQGVLRRAQDGNAVSSSAIEVGRRGAKIAQQAWDLARTLN